MVLRMVMASLGSHYRDASISRFLGVNNNTPSFIAVAIVKKIS